MKYDVIILGGGLSGLTAAIRLAEGGKSAAVIAAGQSSLHFHTGSLGLLGYGKDGAPVAEQAEAAATLDVSHPYSLCGKDDIAQLADEAAALLDRAGVRTTGSAKANHTVLSPLGIDRQAWLSVEGNLTMDALKGIGHVAIVNVAGFMDFYPRFIAAGLKKHGISSDMVSVDIEALRQLRRSESEMRAPNIARVLKGAALEQFASAIRAKVAGLNAGAVIVPAVVGLDERKAIEAGKPVLFAPTMGVSPTGIGIHAALVRRFKALGGTVYNGHRAVKGNFDGDRLVSVHTDRLGDDALAADEFVLATGSFYGRGLTAKPDSVIESALGTDTTSPAADARLTYDLLENQPLFNAGVVTDASLRASKDGKTIINLHAAGSILPCSDAITAGAGAGTAMLPALKAASLILS